MNITVHMTVEEFDDYRLFRQYKNELMEHLKRERLRVESLKPIADQRNAGFREAMKVFAIKIEDADIPNRVKNALLLNEFPKDTAMYLERRAVPQAQMHRLVFLRDVIGMTKEHFIRCRGVYNKAWQDLLTALEKYNIRLDFSGHLSFCTPDPTSVNYKPEGKEIVDRKRCMCCGKTPAAGERLMAFEAPRPGSKHADEWRGITELILCHSCQQTWIADIAKCSGEEFTQEQIDAKVTEANKWMFDNVERQQMR